MNLTEVYLLLFVLLVIVAVASVFFKSRMAAVTPILFAACAVVTLVAQMGVRIREITEGPFAYVDSAMWVLCGSLFSYLLYENGTFQYLFEKIAARRRSPVLQLMLLVLFIAIPGMITGIAAVSILTTGLMVGRYLLDQNVEKTKVVELVSVSALFGVILPPLCMPAMLSSIGRQGSYPGAFEGYFLPCLLAVLPALIVYCAASGRRILSDVEAIPAPEQKGSPLCLIPLVVVAVLVFCHNFLYAVVPFLGYPLIYTIGFVLAVFLRARSADPLHAATAGVRAAAVETALMCAFGAVMETMTLVGVNGTLSAQLLLYEVNTTLYTLVLMALVLLLGFVFGPCMAVAFGTVATYLISNAFWGGAEMPMLSIGILFTVTMFAALRGSLVEQTSAALEVTSVANKEVWSKTWLPAALLVVVAVLYTVASSACTALML